MKTTVVGVMAPGFFGMWSDSEAERVAADQHAAGLALQEKHQFVRQSRQQLHLALTRPGRVGECRGARAARKPPGAIPRLQAANQQGLRELAAQLTDPAERAAMLARTLAVEPFAHGFSGLRSRYSDALYVLTAWWRSFCW